MRELFVRCVVAVVLFGGYWLAWFYNDFALDYFVLPPLHSVPYYALVIGLPSLLAGALIGRWWAPALVLVFVPMVRLPPHCVQDSDVISCGDFTVGSLWEMTWTTAPCILVGALLVIAYRRRPLPRHPSEVLA